MMTNCNPESGVRYGTIYMNHLDPDTADWLWTGGTNVSEEEALKEARDEIECAVQREINEGQLDAWQRESEVEYRMQSVSDNMQIDEPYIEGECEGVKYGISHLGGAGLLWVYWSPHTTRARPCSPCVPNAGDLESLDPEGYECYDVPPDWRPK